MEIVDVPIELLREASWNPNEADEATLRRLAASLGRFGTVLPLVVRQLDDAYEVIGGNQRLRLYRQQGVATVPCVEVQADDVQARLLAQALNAIHGQDDLNKKAALVRDLLASMPEDEVATILPDTVESLRALASLGQATPQSFAEALIAWEKAKAVRLERLSFPFTPAQKEIVEEAIAQALPRVAATDEPNRRALALVEICRDWLAIQENTKRNRHRLRVVSAANTTKGVEQP